MRLRQGVWEGEAARGAAWLLDPRVGTSAAAERGPQRMRDDLQMCRMYGRLVARAAGGAGDCSRCRTVRGVVGGGPALGGVRLADCGHVLWPQVWVTSIQTSGALDYDLGSDDERLAATSKCALLEKGRFGAGAVEDPM
jgi:hypothetical protein